MKILLINNNPVVSRLTALSARKEDVEMDEIQEVTELSSDVYDIVFVDADSWTKDVRDVISENIRTKKSVLFYSDSDDEEERSSFELAILKPFLPSEVSAVIRSIEEETEIEVDEPKESNFDILDDERSSKREDMFILDGLDEFEKKEEAVVKVSDMNFDKKLEEAFPLKLSSSEEELIDPDSKLELDLIEEVPLVEKFEKEDIKKEDIKKELSEITDMDNDLFDLNLNENISSSREASIDMKEEFELEEDKIDLPNELNSIEKLEELPLEIDETEVKSVQKETQVLDETEIEKIKGILTEDIDNELTFEELMTPIATSIPVSDKEEKTEKALIEKEVVTAKASNVDSDELTQTLASMPVETLRELLAGATVKIKIKFPKSK
ncbi:MAG: Highly acidic protein [uncultured Sulfurovum sp.]|uniref:Highly acidic protein n=1 Tax=uncultured Sulfurovum sp. TaxID=269237 RepID=A0A6S6TA21_9BACT|nr:MAG: Highly acidic protein [uncultured Sulfurovum sp.]